MKWIEFKKKQPERGQICVVYQHGRFRLAKYKPGKLRDGRAYNWLVQDSSVSKPHDMFILIAFNFKWWMAIEKPKR